MKAARYIWAERKYFQLKEGGGAARDKRINALRVAGSAFL